MKIEVDKDAGTEVFDQPELDLANCTLPEQKVVVIGEPSLIVSRATVSCIIKCVIFGQLLGLVESIVSAQNCSERSLTLFSRFGVQFR